MLGWTKHLETLYRGGPLCPPAVMPFVNMLMARMFHGRDYDVGLLFGLCLRLRR